MDPINDLPWLAYYVAYSALFTGFWGRTLGKLALGISVVDEQSRKPGLLRALLRETVGKLLSVLFFWLGFLWVAWSSEKPGWHDHTAGTYVIKT